MKGGATRIEAAKPARVGLQATNPASWGVSMKMTPKGRADFARGIKLFRMTPKIPAQAVPNPDPSQPISIHFVIEGGVGGLDIYRL